MAGRPPTKQQTEFGKRLMALRKAKGLTQVEFATMLGVSQNTANYYERTAANPSMELIIRLAEFLDVSPTELLVDEDAASPPPKRRRSGPKSRLDEVVDQVRELPRTEQQRIIEQIEDSLEGARRRARAAE